MLWKAEWDYWTAPDRFPENDSNPPKRIWQTLQENRNRVTTVGGDGVKEADVLPGIRAVAAPGHTIGHTALLFESDGKRLLHIADAAHGYFQMARPEWSPNFDYDKKQAATTRGQLFKRAAREQLLFMAYHFPFPGIGHVVAQNGGLTWLGV